MNTNVTPEDWAQALESDKYEQGIGALKTNKSDGSCRYCCLGVLCDLVDKNRWSTNGLSNLWEDYDASLPSDRIRLIPQNSELFSTHWLLQSNLINLNDNSRLTFKEIAKYIRENVKGIEITFNQGDKLENTNK